MKRLKGRRILVVEDEPDLREAIAESLEDFGSEVIRAENGQSAWKIIESGAQLDCVVSDVRMPGGDGIELLRSIRSREGKRPPLIFLSGFSDFELEQIVTEGAAGLVPKPFDIPYLLLLVAETIEPRG
jgi:CheY-like chemotaxis protein